MCERSLSVKATFLLLIIITPQETPGKYAPFLSFSSDTVVFVSSVLLRFCLSGAGLVIGTTFSIYNKMWGWHRADCR